MIDAVWIDREGVAHTIALPDPTDVMDASFIQGLAGLDESARSTLRTILEEAQADVFDADPALSTSSDERHVGAAPPIGILAGPVHDAADVAEAIRRVDAHWRLDAIMAIDDYLD